MFPSQDLATGKFSCCTGDCELLAGVLWEWGCPFRVGAGGLDFYDVSLVDGYNLPMMIEPRTQQGQVKSGAGICAATGCAVELNVGCPAELKVTDEVACKSACGAFGDERYCCSEAYGSPDTCGPTAYSQYFKNGCPKAYSYVYDDKSSLITFCPSASTNVKAAELTQVPPPDDVTRGTGTSSAAHGGAPPGIGFAIWYWAWTLLQQIF